jgi:putative endonuclease
MRQFSQRKRWGKLKGFMDCHVPAALAMTRGDVLAMTGKRGVLVMALPGALPQAIIIVMKTPCVYILASQQNGTLYVGVTSNLAQRVWQHKEGVVEGFTKKYGIKRLVWYEFHATMESAIAREKQLKAGKRARKIQLIGAMNQDWRDLYADVIA